MGAPVRSHARAREHPAGRLPEEIHRRGFRAASHILARTGPTKGARYHHFPDKNRLGQAVIEEVIRAGLDAMVFTPLREADDPLAALRARAEGGPAVFIVSAWEGCTSIAKNLQSVREYRQCLRQLDRYIARLMA